MKKNIEPIRVADSSSPVPTAPTRFPIQINGSASAYFRSLSNT